MSLGDYIAAKSLSLCAAGIGGLYLILVSYLCGIPFSLVFVLLFSGMLFAVLSLVIGWRRTNQRLSRLKSRLRELPEKYLIAETLDRPRDAVEREYYLLMMEISRSAIGVVEQARAEKQDYCDYVESWVHEIKTPLTACSLILSNGGDPSRLRRELRRADNLTETILTYAKLRTAEKDNQISHTELRAVCNRAIREEMELLIAADISVAMDGDGSVYTDSSLLVFILKQLLINCAKYCSGCQITIILAEDSLSFMDNGPGIPAHELNRVTERGFTGTAGRNRGQSTGMGLYIVSELCKMLNISLEITSEEHCFTRFILHFPSSILQNC
ncbi:MAG: sensor histidine kinase [Oliverpabstia sp.]